MPGGSETVVELVDFKYLPGAGICCLDNSKFYFFSKSICFIIFLSFGKFVLIFLQTVFRHYSRVCFLSLHIIVNGSVWLVPFLHLMVNFSLLYLWVGSNWKMPGGSDCIPREGTLISILFDPGLCLIDFWVYFFSRLHSLLTF